MAANQRYRLHAAMIELVDEYGYDAVKVSDLAQRAGVSTRTFYERFKGKQECLLSTYDFIMQRTARRISSAHSAESDWRRLFELTLNEFLRILAREQQAARFAFVEASAAGLAVLERMRGAQLTFETMVAECFGRAPDGVVVSPLVMKGIVAGLARVVRLRVLAGREHELPELGEEMLGWALCFRSEAAAELTRLGEEITTTATGVKQADAIPPSQAKLAADTMDRKMILSATTGLAADQGYLQLSVPRVRAAAGVSRKSFDVNFDDIQDCFLAALESLTEQVIDVAEQEGSTLGRSWSSGVHRANTTLCAHAAREPALARLAFIEVFAPGPEGMRHREQLTSAIAERFRVGAPVRSRPSELAAEASMGAVWGVVHYIVAGGRTQQLPQLAPALSYLALAPALGAEVAVRAIREEEKRARTDEGTSSTASVPV